jgi:hypothetical protein
MGLEDEAGGGGGKVTAASNLPWSSLWLHISITWRWRDFDKYYVQGPPKPIKSETHRLEAAPFLLSSQEILVDSQD